MTASPVPSRLTLDAAALVLVDFNAALVDMLPPGRREVVRQGAIALSRLAEAFALPTIVLGEGVDLAGPLLPEINDRHAAAPHVRRTTFSAWDTPAFADAVHATGRRQIILAGIATDVCVCLTALDLMRAGFQVCVVADASGSQDIIAEQAALLRLAQTGVVLTSWVGLAGELMGGWQSAHAPAVGAVFHEHIPAVLQARA